MQANIQLTIETLTDAEEKECRVTSARQIQSILRNISENGLHTALYYDDAQDFIMSSLLDVDDKGFWVEQGVDMAKNRRVVESKKITLVSSLDQVKIQLSVDKIHAVTHQGYPAFYLPLPLTLCRIQRREYYRLMFSLSERLRCVIPISKQQGGGQIEVPIMDISGGGLRLFYTENVVGFEPEEIYTGCQINLPEVGKLNATIIVKNLVSISPKPEQTIKRVGCEFKDLDNASNIMLQRYITKMQRAKNDV